VLTYPEALPAKSSSAAGGGDGGGAGGGITPTDTSKDYDYEDESQHAAGNLARSTENPKIPEPFFEQTDVNIYVPINTTSVKLECPVKNYNGECVSGLSILIIIRGGQWKREIPWVCQMS